MTTIAELFAPRSIAIIGASADETKFSGRITPYLLRHGYSGRIHPINAKRDQVHGLPCHADLADVPGDVDCVVYSIAASAIESVLPTCEAKRVKLLMVASAGFAEQGDEEGLRRQEVLTAFARRTGIRVLGPNCVGFWNQVDGVAMAAAMVLEWPDPPRGRIGLISQSGGISLGSVPFNAFERDIGFSRIINTGNEADISLPELTAFLADDPETDVITLAIEGIRDGDAFRAALERAAERGKPVLILKTGRSELGERMAASHTAALTGSDAVFDALCRRTGALRVDDVDELYLVASMFAKLGAAGKLAPGGPAASSDRLGCTGLSVSGGLVGLFGDLGSAAGLAFPPLADATQQGLREDMGAQGPLLNPVDLSGRMVSDHGVWGRALQRLLADPAIQVGVPILTNARNYDPALEDIQRVADETDKIVIVLWVGGSLAGQGKRMLHSRHARVPMFESPTQAIKAMVLLQRYLARRRQPEPSVSELMGERQSRLAALRACRDRLLPGAGTVVGEREAKTFLAELGFPVVREVLVHDAGQAVAAAQTLGYPVVAKGQHPDILHKTDAGIVKLGLDDADKLRTAYGAIVQAMRHHAAPMARDSVLVQEQVPAGVELILGIKRDPVFGPTVLFGMGGIHAEVLREACIELAPLSLAQARRMIEAMRGVALLKGARGRAPADLGALAQLLVTLGDLAAAGFVREVDINPLIVMNRSDDALRVVDALLVLDAPAHGIPAEPPPRVASPS